MKLCGSVKLCRIGWLVAILHFLFVPVVLQAQNLPPVPSHVVANQHAVAGTSFSLTIPANAFRDDNGDVLTYSISGLPSGLSYNSGSRTISGTPTSSGTSTVTLSASDGAASRSKTFTITVHPSGTQTYAAFTMSTKEGCNFKQISFSNKSKGMTSFEWDFDNGDDPVTTIQNPSAIFNRPGTYNVTLTINGGGSSALVHTETITIHSLPSPQITKPIDTGCEPYNTEITGSSGTSSPAYHYWYFFEKSPGQFTSSPNVSLSNLEAGEYSVILQVTDQNGCKGSKIENNLFRIYEIPSADFAYKKSDNCNPSLTTFTDRSIVNDGAISNYRWTVNGNTQSTNNDTLKYNFTTNGEFPVTLQTQSENGCWSDTYSNTIVFNDNNTANFSVNNNYCTSDIVNLSAVTSQGAISYTWDIGNNGSVESTEKDYSHQFNNAGRYDIKLSVRFNDDCNVEVIKTVNVDQITPSFSYNPTYNCNNNTFNVDFNNTSSSHLSNPISTSRWYLVSGLQETLISENNTFTRSFNQPGTYTIKLYTESNNGCSASLTQQIRLQEPSVTIAIGGDVYGCLAGNNVTFDATFTSNFETATSYQWNFGDGQSASGKTTSHQYTSAGNYNISVTVETSSGCSYTTIENNAVQLATPPVITSVDNNQQASQCFGQDLRLNISYTSGTDYLQIASNQGTEEVSNPGSSPYQYWYTPNDTGKVTFNIRAGQYGCLSDAYTVNNIRFNEPRAMFSPSKNIFCDQPYQATFINESDYTDIANTEFYWNFGDGGNSSETSPSHSYTQPGSYTVSLTVSNTSTGCSDTYSEEINIYSFNNTENIIQANKTNTCLNSPVRFSSRMSDYLSPNYEIQELRWDFNNDGTPDSIIYTDMSVDYSYPAPGIYSVSLEVIGVGGCDYLFTENSFITVSGPIIDYINYSPNPLCSGNQATFSTNTRKLSFDTANEDGYSYLWNFGDGTSTDISPTHTFSKDTTYTVSLTVTDDNNCQTTRTQPNLIQLIPFTANFRLPSSIICNDTEIEIENNSTGNISQCLWDFNGDGTIDLTTGNANNVTYNFPTPGTYNVKLTTQVSTGCTKEYTEQITVVYASAEFSAADQNIGCAPAFANFEPYAHDDEVIAYTWNFGDGKTSNERSPQHLYVSPGKYTVSLRIDFIGGCSKTVEKTNYIIVDGAYGVLNYDNTPGCAPYTTSFSVSEMSRVDYITWDFGAGETVRDTVESTYFETTYTYNEMGARTPKVILTDKVCGDYEYSNPTKGSIYTSIPPTPDFTVNFDSVCRDVPILFTDQSTSPDPQYDVANWKWFFGNSQNDSATVETPSFAYPEKGLYSPTLIVSNELGCSDTLTKENSIRIFDNLNLTSNFIISKELACPADRITFRSAAGSTPEAPIVKYEWNFGEGIEQGGTTEYHSYDKSYKGQSIEIIHKVTDNRFCTDSTIRTVEISNLQAAFGYDPQPVFRGSTVDFNDQSTTDAGTQINSWQWNFGNGSPQSSSAENPNNIAYNTIMSDNNVSLIVTNDIGCKDTVARSFDVRNNPPDLDDFTITLIENSSYSFKITDFTDHYSDLDNHSLQTIKIENEAPNGLFRYNGAQYITGTEIPVNNIPLLTFIPNQDWHGQTDCNWTAYDGINWGASPDINFNILERPAPPVLKDVLIEIPKDSVINITRQHFINSIQTTLGNLFQFDSLQILTNHTPQNAGQLLFNNQPVNIPMLILDNEIDNNNAVFEFTPTPNFGGDVSFEWNVFDGFNFADNNGYVIIRYLNSAPQLSDIIYTDVPEDQQVIINKQVFIDHFSDNDIYDIPVTLYISDLPPSSEGVFLFNNQEIRSNFQVSFAQFNQIIFVPAAGFEGTISPTTWKASDGTDTGEAIIQMSFVNTPPIVNDVSVSGFEDTELSLRTINFDNTSTQSPFVDQNPNDRLEAIKILSLPENGTFTFQGAEIVPGDSISRIQIQQVKYMPNSNWFGNTSFEYNAFDGTHWAETPATVFITIQPVNDAPITNSNHYTMLESTVLSNKNISINDSDIDNNISELTYSVAVTDSSTAGQHGNINLLNNGMLTYTPNRYYNGTVEFIYTVCDPENACSKDTVTIRILPINDAPVAYNDTVIIYENERTQSFNCIDNDIDIDGDLPALTHVDGQETSPNVNEYGLIDWDAAGNITFTLDDELQNLSASDALTTQVNYTITDDSLATSNATIYFIIRGINDAPVATNDEFYTTEGFNYISSSDAAYSNILHNDIDPENEAISVVSINNTSENEIDGTYGKLLWNSTGWWRFEEKFNATNSLKQGEIAETTYPYTITDGIDNSQTPGYISIYITGVNDSPVAVNDTITIKENIGELFVDDLNPNVLLNNDSDIDNDEIYIIKVNDTVDNTITTDVGELRWNHNGTYRYTPRIDSVIKLSAVEVAYDIFEYTIIDAFGATASALLVIEIEGLNDAPFAQNDTIVIMEDTHTTVVPEEEGLLINDGDIDDDPIIVSVNEDNTYTSHGIYGTLTWEPSGAYIYTSYPEIVDSLYKDEIVNDIFSYTVLDPRGLADKAKLIISIVGENDAPQANNFFAYINEKDPPLSVNNRNEGILSNDTDIDDGDNFEIIDINQSSDTLTYGTYGELNWNSDGTFIYTLNPETDTLSSLEIVADSFLYTIEDRFDSTDFAWFIVEITGINDNPVAVADTMLIFEDEASKEFNPKQNGVLWNDYDIDGDSVWVLLNQPTIDIEGTYGTLSLSDNGNATYNLIENIDTLNINSLASDVFTYTITDPDDFTSETQFTIYIQGENDAPVAADVFVSILETIDTIAAPANSDISLLTNATDIDKDTLFVPSVNNSIQYSVNSEYGTIEWDSTGAYMFINNRTLTAPIAEGDTVYDTIPFVVADKYAGSDTAMLTIEIIGVNDPPTAVPDSFNTEDRTPLTVGLPENIMTNDYDVDGEVIQVIHINQTQNDTILGQWGMLIWKNDGSFVYHPDSATAVDLLPDETITDEFIYSVEDNLGATDSTSLIIDIVGINNGPTAFDDTMVFIGNTLLQEQEINVLLNDVDPERDPLHLVSIENDTSKSFYGFYGEIFWNENGQVVFVPHPDIVRQLGPKEQATEIYSYTAADSDSATGMANIHIKLVGENDPVQAYNDTTVIDEDTYAAYNVLENDFDPDENFDYGSLNITIQPKNGRAYVNSANGVIYYYPDENFNGIDSLNYRICDEGMPVTCDNAWFFIDVTPINDPPLATHLTLKTNINTPVSFNVFNQVTDIDDGINPESLLIPDSEKTELISDSVLNYTPDSAFTGIDEFIYSLADFDNQRAYVIVNVIVQDNGFGAQDDYAVTQQKTPVEIDILSNDTINGFMPNPISVDIKVFPKNGIAEYNPSDRTIKYTPFDNFNGTDSLFYTVKSYSGNIDFAKVSITVEPTNKPIVANNDISKTTINTQTEIFILNNDYDLDDGIDTTSISILNSPTNGTLNINYAKGTITYTPDTDFLGTDQFSYKVCDLNSDRSCGIARVDILVRSKYNELKAYNDDYSTLENTAVDLIPHPINNDTDFEEEIDIDYFEILNNPIHGTYTLDENKNINYIPTENYNGPDWMQYQICDNNNNCDWAEINIWVEPVNTPPVANNDVYIVSENTKQRLYILSNDYDPDGYLDISSLEIVPGMGPEKGTVEIDRQTGTLLYTPMANSDVDDFTYRICDNEGACSQATVQVNIDLGSIIYYHIKTPEDTPYTFELAPIMANFNLYFDVASFTEITAPELGEWQLNNSNTHLTYEPLPDSTGNDFLNIHLFAGNPETMADLRISIEIIPVNDAPTAITDTVIWNMAANEALTSFDFILENDYDVDGDSISLTIGAIEFSEHFEVVFNETDSTIAITTSGMDWCDSWFTYQINDPYGLSDTGLVQIIPDLEIYSPIAVDDTFDVLMNNVETNAEQMNKTLDVIANDILLNNQRCTIDTIEIISPPRNGSAISESNNTITYTPESYYWGADSLQYRIIDIWGETDTAWAYINVIFQNIPPVAENDNVDLIPGQTFEILILENDYDPDPYPYGYIDTSLTYIVVEQMPQFGQVSIDVNTGIVSYTPVDLTCDDDKFTYVIYDNYGDTASATVTIKAPAEAEIFAYPDTVRTWPTVPVDFNVLENDSGYFIPWVENYTQPFTGNVEQIGDSSFTFYPSSDFIVTDSMMYTLESPCGNTKTGTVIFMIEELRVPEIISPNDDGKNDVLIIDGIEYFPDSWLKIFNRYGHIVYQRKAYDNSWGGYSNRGSLGGNKPLPTGTYYYTLEYNDSKNKQAGIIYIFR